MRQYYISVLADESGKILESRTSILRKIRRAKSRTRRFSGATKRSVNPAKEKVPDLVSVPEPEKSVSDKMKDIGAATTSGAAAGAAIGSIVPGVGTAIGGAVGAAVGSVGSMFTSFFS